MNYVPSTLLSQSTDGSRTYGSREGQFNTIADTVADVIAGSLDSMERGTVEWNSGMVERAINDPVPSYKWANWACALAIDVEKHGMVWIRVPVTGELWTSL